MVLVVSTVTVWWYVIWSTMRVTTAQYIGHGAHILSALAQECKHLCRCNAVRARRMVANMSEIHPPMGMPGLDWSDDGMSGLVPTGMVTLLLADARARRGCGRAAPDEMTAAFANSTGC